MTDGDTEQPVSVVTRREALSGAGLALGSLVASGTLTETVLAQSGGPSDEISGTVEDDSGPVDGATVVAVPHDTSLAALETTTDANGEYIFEQADLHEDSNLYHVIARDGTEASPQRGVPNYPFIAAEGFPESPASGVSRWTFEQHVDDVWGDNDGTDNTSAGYATGQVGDYSKAFDGVDDLVEVPSPTGFDVNDISLSAWIYRDSTGVGGPIMARFPDPGGAGQFYLQVTSNGDLRFDIPFVTANVVVYDTTISASQWYNVLYTRGGDTHTLYLDGSQVAQSTDSSQFTYDGGLRIGNNNSGSFYFDGRIDDPRIYSKTLSGTEVNNLYNTGSINA